MSLSEIEPCGDDTTQDAPFDLRGALEYLVDGIAGLRATVTETGMTVRLDSKDGDWLNANFGPEGLAIECRKASVVDNS